MALDAGTGSLGNNQSSPKRRPRPRAKSQAQNKNSTECSVTYVCKYTDQLAQQCIDWTTVDTMSRHWVFVQAVREKRLNRRSLAQLARGIINLPELLRANQLQDQWQWERRRPEFCVRYLPEQYWEVRSRGSYRYRRNVLQVLFGAHRAGGTSDEYQNEDHHLLHMQHEQEWDTTSYALPPCDSWPICLNPAHWDERDARRRQRQRMAQESIKQRAVWAQKLAMRTDRQMSYQCLVQELVMWFALPFVRRKTHSEGDGVGLDWSGVEEAIRWNRASAGEILTAFPPQPEGTVLIDERAIMAAEQHYRWKMMARFPRSEARRARHWRRLERMVDMWHGLLWEREVRAAEAEAADVYELLTPCMNIPAHEAAARHDSLTEIMNGSAYFAHVTRLDAYARDHPDEFTNEMFIFTQQERIVGAVRQQYAMAGFSVMEEQKEHEDDDDYLESNPLGEKCSTVRHLLNRLWLEQKSGQAGGDDEL